MSGSAKWSAGAEGIGRERWSPRGPVTLDLKKAEVGQRVRRVRRVNRHGVWEITPTEFTGTLTKLNPSGRAGYGAVVLWDNGYEGRVVAASFDLELI